MESVAQWRRGIMRQWLPYVLTARTDGVLLEHRGYAPIGNPGSGFDPGLVLTPAALVPRAALDTTCLETNKRFEHGWLYNDACPPWTTRGNWKQYIRRVESVFVVGALPRALATAIHLCDFGMKHRRTAISREVFETDMRDAWMMSDATPYRYDGKMMTTL